jgi:hypothetical protein
MSNVQAENFMTAIKGIVGLAFAPGCAPVPASPQTQRARALDAAVAEIAGGGAGEKERVLAISDPSG